MKAAGLPVIPGSEGIVAQRSRRRCELAEEIGFPVLLKATAGGGGKGMRVCRDESELRAGTSTQASLEAEKAFGNAGLYLEKFIDGGRHIEFQFMADAFGNAVHLGERECSVQRNHQKLVEESPSPVVDAETARTRWARGSARACGAIGYVDAGTVEFLRDADGQLYFMEVNTRLQVEHPVTEMVTGLDLVARADPRRGQRAALHRRRRTIDARRATPSSAGSTPRIPFDGFRPCPGVVETLRAAGGGRRACTVRVDTHVRPGYRIPVYYDSMIGKLIVHGADREAARRGMLAGAERLQGRRGQDHDPGPPADPRRRAPSPAATTTPSFIGTHAGLRRTEGERGIWPRSSCIRSAPPSRTSCSATRTTRRTCAAHGASSTTSSQSGATRCAPGWGEKYVERVHAKGKLTDLGADRARSRTRAAAVFPIGTFVNYGRDLRRPDKRTSPGGRRDHRLRAGPRPLDRGDRQRQHRGLGLLVAADPGEDRAGPGDRPAAAAAGDLPGGLLRALPARAVQHLPRARPAPGTSSR